MGNIVRRVRHHDSGGDEISTVHTGEHLTVVSHLRLGIYPGVRLEWTIERTKQTRGATLIAFRSTTGFCPIDDPDELGLHGQMFLKTTEDGQREDHLPEGVHFYTFILRRPGIFREKRSDPVCFTETIPSAKVAIGRMHDQLALKQLMSDLALASDRHDISQAEVELKLRAAKQRLKELSASTKKKKNLGYRRFKAEHDRQLEQMSSTTRYLSDLQNDPRFQQLSEDQQADFLRRVREESDPREFGLEP